MAVPFVMGSHDSHQLCHLIIQPHQRTPIPGINNRKGKIDAGNAQLQDELY